MLFQVLHYLSIWQALCPVTSAKNQTYFFTFAHWRLGRPAKSPGPHDSGYPSTGDVWMLNNPTPLAFRGRVRIWPVLGPPRFIPPVSRVMVRRLYAVSAH